MPFSCSFTDLFEGDKADSTAGIDYCTTVSFSFWDDKENLDVAPGDFSPSPQTRPCLPFEVNIHQARQNACVWDSRVVLTQPAPFDLGWVKTDLVSVDDAQDTYSYSLHNIWRQYYIWSACRSIYFSGFHLRFGLYDVFCI